ncbi:MAG: glycosyltransferase [Phreatobacter sp.]
MIHVSSAQGRRRPVILHVSSDYPNPLRTPTTNAVERLVDRLTDYDQVVISLQRIDNPRRTYWRDLGMVNGRRVIAHGYFAPPFGIAMLACQARLAMRIRRFLRSEAIRPDIVHSHRFTFEGIASGMGARATGAALFFSVRGEVEGKVFATKPTYRPLFRRMARDATRVFYVSAWFRARFEAVTGVDRTRTRLLPNFVYNTRPVIPATQPRKRIVCAMTLTAIDKKGLPELLKAFAEVAPAMPDIVLDIVGDGPEAARARVRGLIEDNGLAGRAFLRGPMEHHDLLDDFAQVLALAMPSHNETFGMVFPEALFAGAPILYSRATGIDGYLDGLDVGVAVDPGNVDAIARGLVRLVEDNAHYRQNIRDAAATLFERFDPALNLARYRADVEGLTAAPPVGAP